MVEKEKRIPSHIAIIMDGNGRWAKKRGLPRTFGHREGVKSLRKTITYAGEIGVNYLTVFAFSTENWNRSKEEVDTLMFLFKKYLKSEEKTIMKNNVRFFVSGRKDNVSKDLLKSISHLEELSKDNTGLTLNIMFNYGGRAEIIDAVNSILKDSKDHEINDIDETEFKKHLYLDIPDPDLLIRTSGEMRISNFLLWQLAYSEIYITDVLWPDFSEETLDEAINEYNKRDRRFGGAK